MLLLVEHKNNVKNVAKIPNYSNKCSIDMMDYLVYRYRVMTLMIGYVGSNFNVLLFLQMGHSQRTSAREGRI